MLVTLQKRFIDGDGCDIIYCVILPWRKIKNESDGYKRFKAGSKNLL